MKIRTGFVSNSSTTSFCIYGSTFSAYSGKELIQALIEKFKDKIEADHKQHPIKEPLEKWIESLKTDNLSELAEIVSFVSEIDYWQDHNRDRYWFGTSLLDMKDDETKQQFKDRVESTMKEIGFTKFDFHSEGWYNG